VRRTLRHHERWFLGVHGDEGVNQPLSGLRVGPDYVIARKAACGQNQRQSGKLIQTFEGHQDSSPIGGCMRFTVDLPPQSDPAERTLPVEKEGIR
jgi:hypothetical protein